MFSICIQIYILYNIFAFLFLALADELQNSRSSKIGAEPDDAYFAGYDHDVSRKLYLSNLLPSTDSELIFSMFGVDNVDQVSVFDDDNKNDG